MSTEPSERRQRHPDLAPARLEEHLRSPPAAGHQGRDRFLDVRGNGIRASLAQDIHDVGRQLGVRFRWLRTGFLLFGTAVALIAITFAYIQWRMFV